MCAPAWHDPTRMTGQTDALQPCAFSACTTPPMASSCSRTLKCTTSCECKHACSWSPRIECDGCARREVELRITLRQACLRLVLCPYAPAARRVTTTTTMDVDHMASALRAAVEPVRLEGCDPTVLDYIVSTLADEDLEWGVDAELALEAVGPLLVDSHLVADKDQAQALLRLLGKSRQAAVQPATESKARAACHSGAASNSHVCESLTRRPGLCRSLSSLSRSGD